MKLLDRLLHDNPGASRQSAKRWLSGRRVKVEGVVETRATLEVDAKTRISLSPRAAAAPPGGLKKILRVVHEDRALLVVDKPPGALSVPTEAGDDDNTMLGRATKYLEGKNQQAFSVHRLDRKTSGLLIFAKDARTQERLQAQFKERTVIRKYLARVEGKVKDSQGTLTHWLQEDERLFVNIVAPPKVIKADAPPSGRRKPAPEPKPGDPKPIREAITHYRVLERGEKSTLLAISIKTGRRAQIRVQLASMGHPVLGDHQYGHAEEKADRLLLFASGLQFVHPFTGKPVKLELPPPDAFLVDSEKSAPVVRSHRPKRNQTRRTPTPQRNSLRKSAGRS